jgi:hypothetical protein
MAYPAWAHHPSNEAFGRLCYRVKKLEEELDDLKKSLTTRRK